jgi:hypothetical protein
LYEVDWEADSSKENSVEAEIIPNGSPTEAPKVDVRDTEFSFVLVTSLPPPQM